MRELVALLNLPPSIETLTITADGYWLARSNGDIGFNLFLGAPTFKDGPGRDAMRRRWMAYSFRERKAAVKVARALRLSIREMLGPRSPRSSRV